MLNKFNLIISRILFLSILVSLTLLVTNTTLIHNKKLGILLLLLTVALFFIWTSIPLIISTAISYPRARKRFNMKVWRYAIKTRRYYKLTPINNFILHIGSMLILISTPIFFLLYLNNESFIFTPSNAYLIFTPAAIIMSISFSIDFYNRAIYLLKKIWSGVFGKGIIALLATLSFIISKFLAHHWIYTTTNIDPKYFIDFNSIMILFFTPVAYLILVGLLSIMIVTPELIVIYLASLLLPLKPIIFPKTLIKLEQLLMRLRTGKRLDQLNSSEKALLKSNIIYFRILSSIIFFGLVFYFFSFISKFTYSFWDSTARLGLVTYYYSNEVKNNQPNIRYYNYEGEKKSQAFYNGKRWEFIPLNKKIHDRSY